LARVEVVLVRPEQKRRREHEQVVAALKRGDRVVLASGIHGRVTAAADKTVSVEIARGVQVDAFPDNIGAPHYSDPVWEPLWSEIASAGIPLSFHIQGPRSMQMARLFDPTPGVREAFISLAPMGISELIAQLIFQPLRQCAHVIANRDRLKRFIEGQYILQQFHTGAI